MVSGLKINLQKSKLIGLGVASSHDMDVARHIGCAFDPLQFIHLGFL